MPHSDGEAPLLPAKGRSVAKSTDPGSRGEGPGWAPPSPVPPWGWSPRGSRDPAVLSHRRDHTSQAQERGQRGGQTCGEQRVGTRLRPHSERSS